MQAEAYERRLCQMLKTACARSSCWRQDGGVEFRRFISSGGLSVCPSVYLSVHNKVHSGYISEPVEGFQPNCTQASVPEIGELIRF